MPVGGECGVVFSNSVRQLTTSHLYLFVCPLNIYSECILIG